VENLSEQDQPDPKKKWKEIREQFLSGPFLTIKRDVARYHAHNCQILRPIRQFHRHQREMYLEKLDKKRNERAKKRRRLNTRASMVYYQFLLILFDNIELLLILALFYIYLFIYFIISTF